MRGFTKHHIVSFPSRGQSERCPAERGIGKEKTPQAHASTSPFSSRTLSRILGSPKMSNPPVWRNGRRTGLKIFKITLSDHFLRLLITRVSANVYRHIFNFSLVSPHP
jgi:hypothetical protein